jgi:hypothetical protein
MPLHPLGPGCGIFDLVPDCDRALFFILSLDIAVLLNASANRLTCVFHQ